MSAHSTNLNKFCKEVKLDYNRLAHVSWEESDIYVQAASSEYSRLQQMESKLGMGG